MNRGAQISDGAMLGYIFAAAQSRFGLRVCGWCGKWLGLARELAEGAVTHGICPECEAQVMKEAETFDRAGSRRTGDEPETSSPRPTSSASLAGPVVFPWSEEKFKPEVCDVA